MAESRAFKLAPRSLRVAESTRLGACFGAKVFILDFCCLLTDGVDLLFRSLAYLVKVTRKGACLHTKAQKHGGLLYMFAYI
jgi:hypothetical protein